VSGEVRVFAQYDRRFEEVCDAVVVGSGPGGAVVARELARAGKDVVLIEEGPPFTPRDLSLDGPISMARTMREDGLRATRGYVMSTMQAIALGGGSLVNSAICVRAPSFMLDAWSAEFELARSSHGDLDPHYAAVEKFLGIASTPDDVQGPRNLLFREGCEALRIPCEPIPRNVRGCRGSGECFTGCRARAKQSTDISYVPDAVHAGARVLTSCRVERVLTQGQTAVGVEGRVVRPFTGETSYRFTIRARTVVLAAGCLATPLLLQRSGGIANGSGAVGNHLQFHPGIAIMGVFPDRTEPQFGATQGYQSVHFLREGFKLETLWAPPGVLAVRLPGFGFDLKQHLAQIPYAAIWDGFASTQRSFGTVRAQRSTLDPAIRWNLHPDDVKILGKALWMLARIFFAAGARKILPGVHRVPDEIRSLDEAEILRVHDYLPTDLTCGGNHVFGTTRMHGDPRKGVVDEYGRCHEMDNLYIADTGVFPRSPSVNPMFTVMALAHRTAGHIVDAG
jgi:choline dehydrogenase-like flavoprotein